MRYINFLTLWLAADVVVFGGIKLNPIVSLPPLLLTCLQEFQVILFIILILTTLGYLSAFMSRIALPVINFFWPPR